MDNRSLFIQTQVAKKGPASPAAEALASLHHRAASFSDPHSEEREEVQAADAGGYTISLAEAARQRPLTTIRLRSSALPTQAFVPGAAPRGAAPVQGRGKMGFTFRNSRNEASVFIGKRTVKDGECCGIWDLSGQYKSVVGPKRRWLFFSRIRFCDRLVADSHQYLEVRYRNGQKEHKRGPIAMFEDPVAHESITVMNAVTVDAFEVVVVYTEDAQGNVKRSVVSGPTVFIPEVTQWLHVFRWHGAPPGGDQFMKVPGALVFTKLRTIPDQFYYNAQGVRTSDDASLTVKVMVFYSLNNIELMLNSTHDPIGDFINALLADLMNFSSRHTYEQFIQCAQQLSELDTFPVLCTRAEAVGFKVTKVVYRGYQASSQLQDLCDQAIKTRTELKLKQEEQEQHERIRSMELMGSHSRGGVEREEAAAQQVHNLQLEAAAHKATLERQEEEHRSKMRQMQELQQLELEARKAADEARTAHLAGLGELGVDLTQYLVACAEKQPDKVLKVVGAGLPGAGLGELGVDLAQYLVAEVACAEKQPDKVLKVAGAGVSGAGTAMAGVHIHTSP